jgi:hypothetical protein
MPKAPRTHLRFRVEPRLQEQLDEARKKSGLTLTGEITERLKKSVAGETSVGVTDLRDYLIGMRRDMMEEMRRELNHLRIDLSVEEMRRDLSEMRRDLSELRAALAKTSEPVTVVQSHPIGGLLKITYGSKDKPK